MCVALNDGTSFNVGHTSVSLIQEGLKHSNQHFKESLTLGMDGEQQEKVRGLRRKLKNKVNVTFQSAVL